MNLKLLETCQELHASEHASEEAAKHTNGFDVNREQQLQNEIDRQRELLWKRLFKEIDTLQEDVKGIKATVIKLVTGISIVITVLSIAAQDIIRTLL